MKSKIKSFISKIKRKINKRKKEKSNASNWLWEFSKKVVFWCFLLYMIEQTFLMVFYWRMGDTMQLTNLNDNITTVLKDCVFAYFVKAAIENVFKIKIKDKENEEQLTEQDFPEAK